MHGTCPLYMNKFLNNKGQQKYKWGKRHLWYNNDVLHTCLSKLRQIMNLRKQNSKEQILPLNPILPIHMTFQRGSVNK